MQKYWNRLYRFAIITAAALAGAGALLAFLPKITQFQSYQQTKHELETDIRRKQEQIKDLRLKQERFGTDRYFVQQMAHKIGYAHESETVFQFNDESATNDQSNPPESDEETR